MFDIRTGLSPQPEFDHQGEDREDETIRPPNFSPASGEPEVCVRAAEREVDLDELLGSVESSSVPDVGAGAGGVVGFEQEGFDGGEEEVEQGIQAQENVTAQELGPVVITLPEEKEAASQQNRRLEVPNDGVREGVKKMTDKPAEAAPNQQQNRRCRFINRIFARAPGGNRFDRLLREAGYTMASVAEENHYDDLVASDPYKKHFSKPIQ